ncbi:MAG: hypothetical protein QOH91_263 [Mycobacterium sp.]|jgi:uncharacterized protein (TIGR03084 family)|nr:hypothetical protein [Mycobacterium sp.]
MALDFAKLLADLRHESDGLLACLDGLRTDQWEELTPALGWAIRDQVSHLAYFDDVAYLVITDAAGFQLVADGLVSNGTDFPDLIAAEFRSLATAELTEWFSRSRARVMDAFAGHDPRRRLPWFGPAVISSLLPTLCDRQSHRHS